MERGKSGRPRSGHGWTVFGERKTVKENKGPCHLLCAEREAGWTPLAKSIGEDGDGEAGREFKREK